MQTYLYLHKENIDLPQSEYRGKYPLKHFDYGLSRNVGRIVTLDEHETTFAKLQFSGASVRSYRMNYDSRVKKGVVTIIVIEAKEIVTDNDLFFKNK